MYGDRKCAQRTEGVEGLFKAICTRVDPSGPLSHAVRSLNFSIQKTASFAKRSLQILSFYYQAINRLISEARTAVHYCLLENYEVLQRAISQLQCDLTAVHHVVTEKEFALQAPTKLPWFSDGHCVHMGYKCLAHAAEVTLQLQRVTRRIRRAVHRYNHAYCPLRRRPPRC